jgi:N-terminal domain of galactosyltransferase
VDVSVLIPWRGGDPQRERVLEYVLMVWDKTGADICVGEDDPGGPFNCSRAQNRAFQLAKHDKLIMIGADTVPSFSLVQMVYNRLDTVDWFPLFHETAYYSRESTERILSGAPRSAEAFEYVLPFCTGPVALTRDAYLASGGMDERFSGWGYEDAAFRQTLAGLFGAPPANPDTCCCLWHETGHRNPVSPNEVLMRDYLPLTEPGLTRAYLDQRGSFLELQP